MSPPYLILLKERGPPPQPEMRRPEPLCEAVFILFEILWSTYRPKYNFKIMIAIERLFSISPIPTISKRRLTSGIKDYRFLADWSSAEFFIDIKKMIPRLIARTIFGCNVRDGGFR